MKQTSGYKMFVIGPDSEYARKLRFTGTNVHLVPPRAYYVLETTGGKIVFVWLNTLHPPLPLAEHVRLLCYAKVGKGVYKENPNAPAENVVKVTIYGFVALNGQNGKDLQPFDSFVRSSVTER